PKPLQQPHPPVYVASISPPSLRLAAENNFGFVAAFKPLQEERETMGLYRTVWSEHHSGEMPVCGTMKIAYVAESDAKAREDVQEMLTQNLAAFARWGFPTPAQYAQVPALAQAYDRESYTHASKGIGDRTFDQMVEDGLILVGGPDTVIRKIQDIRSAGYGRVLLAMAFGEVPIAKAENSLELVGREVIPAVRSL
ncbi:MAG: LLM class flavin-dependent oxidoreductase, partial [Chloroflexi bacterium]|nr:LLM class flavin-dependent oxidoreductase [Chloroflexota bacterium]